MGILLGDLPGLCWCFVRDVTGTSVKLKEESDDKADSSKHDRLK